MTRRRRWAVGVGLVVVLGLLAACNAAAAQSNSRWLAGKLNDGLYESPWGGPDYGLSIDGALAMYASGNPELAEPIAEVFDDQAQAINYFSYAGFLGPDGLEDRIAGATAKTLVMAEASGRNPRDFGGYDMVAETQSTILREGPEAGRVSDYGPNTFGNNANTFGQALAVIGLAGVDANDRSVIDMLRFQQCSEGYFRIFYSYDAADHTIQSCDEGKATGASSPDGDSTGMGLSALLAAREAGARGLDGAIARARAWLKENQDASGGWGGGVGTEAPNTNSTGLIVQALADAGGARHAVRDGADYLRSAQVTEAADADTALSGEIGAIAYNPADYQAARSTGITSLDTWIRASAQASLGLSQVGFYDLVTAGGRS